MGLRRRRDRDGPHGAARLRRRLVAADPRHRRRRRQARAGDVRVSHRDAAATGALCPVRRAARNRRPAHPGDLPWSALPERCAPRARPRPRAVRRNRIRGEGERVDRRRPAARGLDARNGDRRIAGTRRRDLAPGERGNARRATRRRHAHGARRARASAHAPRGGVGRRVGEHRRSRRPAPPCAGEPRPERARARGTARRAPLRGAAGRRVRSGRHRRAARVPEADGAAAHRHRRRRAVAAAARRAGSYSPLPGRSRRGRQGAAGPVHRPRREGDLDRPDLDGGDGQHAGRRVARLPQGGRLRLGALLPELLPPRVRRARVSGRAAVSASHGCARIPMWIATTVYGEMPDGSTVYVY